MESIAKNGRGLLYPKNSRPVKIGEAVIGFVTDKRKRTRKSFAFAGQRLSEIQELIRARHGAAVDTDDADIYLPHLAAAAVNDRRATLASNKVGQDDAAFAAVSLCRKWLPLIPIEEIAEAAEEAADAPRYEKADDLAKALRVTFAERQRLGLKTIGACDLTKAQRKKAIKTNRLERQTAKRRASGVRERGSFVTVAEIAKSWGVSRQTVYDWRKRNDPRGLYISEEHIGVHISASEVSSQRAKGALKAPVARATPLSVPARKAQVPQTHPMDRRTSNLAILLRRAAEQLRS